MRPPICAICHIDFREDSQGGGTVQFVLTSEDRLQNERLKVEGMSGHPAGLEWFCAQHISKAKEFSHLTLSQALRKIQESKEL